MPLERVLAGITTTKANVSPQKDRDFQLRHLQFDRKGLTDDLMKWGLQRSDFLDCLYKDGIYTCNL